MKRNTVTKKEYQLALSAPVFEFIDGYSNLCQRLIALAGSFVIHTEGEVVVADEVDHALGAPFEEIQYLPDSVLCYLLPSRYCESDLFGSMVTEITVGQLPVMIKLPPSCTGYGNQYGMSRRTVALPC